MMTDSKSLDSLMETFDKSAWNRAKKNRPTGLPSGPSLIKTLHHQFIESADNAPITACFYHRTATDYYTMEEGLCHFLLSISRNQDVCANLVGIHFNDQEAEKKTPNLENLYPSLKFGLALDTDYQCRFGDTSFIAKLTIKKYFRSSGQPKALLLLELRMEQPVPVTWVRELLTAAYNYNYPQIGGYQITRKKRHTLNILTNDSGYWVDSYQVPKRSFDSVFIDQDVRLRLKKLLEKKFDFDWYQRKGLSAKLSILLHGKPGTGKTSLIRSIASELECGIHVLNLNGVKDDTEFNKLIRYFTRQKIDSDSDSNSDSDSDSDKGRERVLEENRDVNLLVIEDIDCIFQNRKTKDGGFSGVTMSTLLNILDGFMTVDNLIIFITTNFPNKLDEALKRPGRIDFNIEMKYPTADHVVNCYRWIFSLDDEQSDHPDQSAELKKHLEEKRSQYQNISLGLYQQYFVYCYKNGYSIIERLSDLKQMVNDFREISPNDTPQGMYV
jgi:hypothetical protein